MLSLDSSFVCQATGGQLQGAEFVARRCSKDTREDLLGALYVALRGERFDGHDFAAAALQGGAAAVLIERRALDLSTLRGSAVLVADTGQALLDLAAAHLRRLPGRRVALTGSNGKTTTKEMIAAIARAAFGEAAVHATTANLNNQIGMPMTALAADQHARVIVLEMGMNHPGEIASMAAAARPQVALINNVQPAHLQGLGSLQAIAEAKGELFAALGEDAIAVVNQDDPSCVAQAERCAAGLLRFGRQGGVDVRLVETRHTVAGQQLVLDLRGERVEVALSLRGAHNAANASAAAAVGLALDLDAATIARGLADAPSVSGRLTEHVCGDLIVIDDSYNANPASMRAALDVAAERAGEDPLWLVLGEMKELGAQSQALHVDIGQRAAALRPHKVWFCGSQSEAYARGAVKAGLDRGRMALAADAGDIIDAVVADVGPRGVLLAKGSRSARCERVIDALLRDRGVDGGLR